MNNFDGVQQLFLHLFFGKFHHLPNATCFSKFVAEAADLFAEKVDS